MKRLPDVKIFGIDLIVIQSSGYFRISSPQWNSLRTHGKTLNSAMTNMMQVIADVAPGYMFSPDKELGEDAIELKKFFIEKLLK